MPSDLDHIINNEVVKMMQTDTPYNFNESQAEVSPGATTEQLAASPGHLGENSRMMLLMSQPKRQSQQTGSAGAEDENLLSGPVYP